MDDFLLILNMDQDCALRGHNSEKLTLKPSFGNIILWKSIYHHKGYFYVDAIRVFNSSQSSEINIQQRSDIERFRWFSQDYNINFSHQ